MTTRSLFGIGCALFALGWSAEAKAESAREIAAKVQAFYDQAKSYRASFTQRYRLKAYNKEKTSEGRVVFLKPGKMSFRYASNGNRVVSDAKTVKIYEASNRQLYEQSIEKSQYPAALSFLLGQGKLTREFELRKIESKGFERGHVISAKPKEPTAAYRAMVLYVDAETYQVRRVVLVDAQGNRNRFDFSAAKVNQKVKPKEFEFTPPPGTKIVR